LLQFVNRNSCAAGQPPGALLWSAGLREAAVAGDDLTIKERRALLDLLYGLLRTTADVETRRRTLWLAWWIEGTCPIAAMRLAESPPCERTTLPPAREHAL
jgi:hypothetical protein